MATTTAGSSFPLTAPKGTRARAAATEPACICATLWRRCLYTQTRGGAAPNESGPLTLTVRPRYPAKGLPTLPVLRSPRCNGGARVTAPNTLLSLARFMCLEPRAVIVLQARHRRVGHSGGSIATALQRLI